MVASNSDIAAALASIVRPQVAAPIVKAPTVDLSGYKTPQGVGGILDAINALNAVSNQSAAQSVLPKAQVQDNVNQILAGIAARAQAQHNSSPVNIDFNDTKSTAPASQPSWKWLYTGLNDTLGQLGGAVRTGLDTAVNDVKKDIGGNAPWWQKGMSLINDLSPQNIIGGTVADGAIAGAKQQWKDWTDGNFSIGDLGGGFLDGMANSWKSGTQLNQDAGVNNFLDNTLGLKNSMLQNQNVPVGKINNFLANQGWMNHVPILDALHQASQGIMAANPNGSEGINQLAGLATEAITDPLTYADGVGIATKAGKLAEMNKIGEWGSKIGMDTKGLGNTKEFIDAATNHLTNQYATEFPNIASQMAKAVTDNAREDIAATHAATYNANMNKFGFSLPMSNAHVAIGTMPEKIFGMTNPLFKSEAVLGDNYAHLAKDVVNQLAGGNANHAAAIENAFKTHYNVNDLSNLTKTQFTDMLQKSEMMKPSLDKIISNQSYKGTLKPKGEPTPTEINPNHPLAGDPMVNFAQSGEKTIARGAVPKVENPATYGKEALNVQADKILNDAESLKNAPDGGWNKTVVDVQNAMKKVQTDGRVKKGLSPDELYNRVAKKDPNLPSSLDELIHNAQLEHNAAQHTPSSIVSHLEDSLKSTTKSKNFKLRTDGKENTTNFNKALADLSNSKYTKFNNAKSALDHFFEGKNPFNARTLGTGDKFLNSMANHVADAGSYRVGNIAQYAKPMNKIDSYIKKNGLNEKDMMDTIYHLEGKAPHSYGANWTPSAKVQGLADMIKPVLDKLGSSEHQAGVLDALKENYFPHVNKLSPEDAKAMKEFTDRHPELKGQSEANAFNNERTTFPTMADRQNHLDKLDEEMQKTTDPAKLNSLNDQFNKVKGMFDTNISSALTSRIREGVRAESMKAMHGELSKYGMLIKDAKEVPPAGYTKLDSSQMKKFGLSGGQYHIQKDVLKGMERVDGIFKHDGMEKFVRQVGAFTDIFRAGVTTYKLSHYVNNVVGNVINNMAAGVKVSEYNAARKLIQAMRNGTTTTAQDAILKSAFDKNVISGGFVSDLASHGGLHIDDPTKLEKLAQIIGNNKFAKGVRQQGEMVDDVARLGNYINGLNKFGGDAGKAAEQVRTYLFNYNEMTNADRTMRAVIPFWNWTKRNIPLQLKNLMEKPAIAMNFERAKVAANSNQQGADWQKDTGFKIPFMNNYVGLPSPTDDLKQFMHPLQFLSSVNPAIRIPIEMATNRQLYTGNPISYGSNTLQAKDIPSYVAKNFGIAGNVNDLIQSTAGTNNKTVPEVIDNYLKSMSKINPKSGVN